METLIAFSIAYVAIENLVGKGHALSTLVAFNLGVEAGQLVIVTLVFDPLTWWARQSWYRQSGTVASTLILLVASWWVVERAFAIQMPIQ